MKNKWIISAILCACAVTTAVAQNTYMPQPGNSSWIQSIKEDNVSAQDKTNTVGIKKGENRISFLLGIGIPTTDTREKDAAGSDIEWGRTGVNYGLQALTFVTDDIALGAEVNGVSFGKGDSFYLLPTVQAEAKMNVTNFMFATRLYANSTEKARFYIPAGLGFANIHGKMTGNGLNTLSFSDTSFAFYIGLGTEVDLEKNWTLGAEARFNHSDFKTEEYGLPLDFNVQYISLLFHLGYRF